MKKKYTEKKINHPDRMYTYWRTEWKAVSVIVLTGLLYNGAMGLGPILQGKVIDLIVAAAPREQILRAIAVFLAVIFAVQFSRYLKRYFVRIFANRTNMAMRREIYRRIMDSSVKDAGKNDAGDLLTRGISDVSECVEGMRKFTTEVFDTGVLMLAYFVMLLGYDVKITLVSVIFIPAAMFIADRMKKLIYGYTKKFRAQLSRVSSLTLENVENELLYRMNGVEEIKTKNYDRELSDLRQKAVLANMLENSMQPVYRVIGMIGMIIVIFWGGEHVVSGTWSIGTFSAYVAIFASFSKKSSKASKLFNSMQKAQVSWQRIKPLLEMPYQGPKPPAPVSFSSEPLVRVRNLNAGIIKGADFDVEKGKITGVTGPVASGKSTVGRAASGMISYEGSIKIGGKEISTIESSDLPGYVSYMGHDSSLLSDTIYHNITLGKEGDVHEVLRAVCFDEDLKSMPEGINTRVGSYGVRLSGGQKARLALARTLYNQAPLIILDDPFAAVDVNTEKQIMKNLENYCKESGILLISHRITAFDRVDKVLLTDDGRTEFDTHENLMKKSALYREIFRMQAKGGKQ